MIQSQATRLYELLKDGRPHRSDEILTVVYGSEHKGLARPGARVDDLRNGRWPGKTKCTFLNEDGTPCEDTKWGLKGWKDHEYQTLYWYWMQTPIVNSQNVNCKPIVTKPGVPQPLFDLPKSTAHLWAQ